MLIQDVCVAVTWSRSEPFAPTAGAEGCSSACARWADPPYLGRGILGSDFAGLGIVYWLLPESEDAQAAIAERDAFAEQVTTLERQHVKTVKHEAVFECSGERPGVVGGMLIDALQNIRRSQS